MSSCVCKILFKSEQICGCCCKMLRGSLFWDTRYFYWCYWTPRFHRDFSNIYKKLLLPAPCYASVGASHGRVSVCLSLCLCLSVTSWSSVETAGRIELGFGMWASFHLSYSVLKGNSRSISRNKGSLLWNFVAAETPDLKIILLRRISIIETCYQLSSTTADAQSKLDAKLDRRRSAGLTIPPSSDARLL